MVIWIIGMSASGKTTIGSRLFNTLKPQNKNLVFLDGDVIRQIYGETLGYTLEDRKKNADRICSLCKFLDQQNINVICSILSIFEDSRKWNRENFTSYFEIFLDVKLENLIRRDIKGLYKNAQSGKEKNVVGIDIPFPMPETPDMIIDNNPDRKEFEDIIGNIINTISETNHNSLNL